MLVPRMPIDNGLVEVHVTQLIYATFSATCAAPVTAKTHLVSAFLRGRALRRTQSQEPGIDFGRSYRNRRGRSKHTYGDRTAQLQSNKALGQHPLPAEDEPAKTVTFQAICKVYFTPPDDSLSA
ncbi:hypothetical protein PMIN03_011751 [Paraphaeosphaeria minitans]